MNTEQAEVTVIPDRPRYSQASDSDSDGPILYRDETDEEEDDEYTNSRALFFFLTFCKKPKNLLNILEELLHD